VSVAVNRKRLYLIDGMSHIYRAYFAIPNLSNSKGFPTNAAYGFTAMLRKLIKEEKPDYIAVAFDVEGVTERQQKFGAYKATRKPMPDGLAQQIPYIERICQVFRVPVIGYPGYEADDVIGTLARKAVAAGLTVMVVTSDKDMLQLVSDGDVVVVDPMKNNLVLDTSRVVEKMGVLPAQVPDLLGLWGDSVDNIPGAPGIGEKGARDLIQTFGTLESCLENWQKAKRKQYQESLRDNVDLIRMSKELATIHTDLPIALTLDSLVSQEPDREGAFQLFAELEFKGLMNEFLDERKQEPALGEWFVGSEAVAFLERFASGDKVFFSLEYRQEPLSRYTAVAASVQGESGKVGLLDLTDGLVAQAWERVLGNSGIVKVCWDAKLALIALGRRELELACNMEDVMLMAFLSAPHIGDYSLRRWALDQLHATLPDEKSKGQTTFEVSARDALKEILCTKLELLRRLYDLIRAQMETLGINYVYKEIELPLIPVLADMECTGIKVDRLTLREMSTVMETQLNGLTAKIYESAGTEFNINSPKQLGEVLFDRLHLPTSKKTRTGGFSTDQAVLEELAESYELPRLILDFRQIAKLKSTYVDALPLLIHPKTGRVHTSYNQTGAATGRLSSSDPNLQNIPVRSELGRLIRGAFIPESGNLLISADYSQVELRVLAHLSEDPVLTDAFRRDEDIHDRTAREVFSEAELADRGACRRRAKVINFGIVYGLSAFGLAQKLGIGREEAQAFIDAYFAKYQGVRRWLDLTIEETRKSGRVQTLFGRIRPIPDILSRDHNARMFAERTAVNTPIQGTAADIIKIAMIRIHKDLQQSQRQAKILLQVHDELVLEVPEGELDEVRHLVRTEMEHAAEFSVPLKVDLNVADNWKDMK
jgi:DNA polymerase I